MLPAPRFTCAFLWRATVIWFGLKAVVTGAARALGAREPGATDPLRQALQLAPVTVVALAAVVAALTLIDARRRNELLFLGNVGVSRGVIAGLAAIPVLAAEVILGLFL